MRMCMQLHAYKGTSHARSTTRAQTETTTTKKRKKVKEEKKKKPVTEQPKE